MRRWSGKVGGLCHALVRQPHAIEELTQETFVRGYVALHSLREPQAFPRWICGIARNVCRDWIQHHTRSEVPFSQLADDWRPEEHIPERGADVSVIEAAEDASHLRTAIDRLPEDYRTVLTLYYYGDHTYADLAAMLDVSTATINVRLTKARALLRRRLQPTVREP